MQVICGDQEARASLPLPAPSWHPVLVRVEGSPSLQPSSKTSLSAVHHTHTHLCCWKPSAGLTVTDGTQSKLGAASEAFRPAPSLIFHPSPQALLPSDARWLSSVLPQGLCTGCSAVLRALNPFLPFFARRPPPCSFLQIPVKCLFFITSIQSPLLFCVPDLRSICVLYCLRPSLLRILPPLISFPAHGFHSPDHSRLCSSPALNSSLAPHCPRDTELLSLALGALPEVPAHPLPSLSSGRLTS